MDLELIEVFLYGSFKLIIFYCSVSFFVWLLIRIKLDYHKLKALTQKPMTKSSKTEKTENDKRESEEKYAFDSFQKKFFAQMAADREFNKKTN